MPKIPIREALIEQEEVAGIDEDVFNLIRYGTDDKEKVKEYVTAEIAYLHELEREADDEFDLVEDDGFLFPKFRGPNEGS